MGKRFFPFSSSRNVARNRQQYRNESRCGCLSLGDVGLTPCRRERDARELAPCPNLHAGRILQKIDPGSTQDSLCSGTLRGHRPLRTPARGNDPPGPLICCRAFGTELCTAAEETLGSAQTRKGAALDLPRNLRFLGFSYLLPRAWPSLLLNSYPRFEPAAPGAHSPDRSPA